MVTIKDGCGCDPCGCDWKQKLKEAYSRAIQSVNKIGDNDGSVYFPDGTGFVKLPLPRQSDVAQIKTNTQDIADLKIQGVQLQAKDDLLDANISRIDATDTTQNERIQDNADRITTTYNDLVSTEATVATHDSNIITLQAQTQALSKSLVSDVMMTDGTTAGSVQVSIEREDGALITSANYKWGRDIGVRLEAGTQAGYIKTVISLSDGTVLESNEYKIVEVLESDVYVTAITLVPDMAAGTIGGNISYSNGTTQTINTINVPTAPGVTSAIEALQGRMTAVEQKNTQQDASISSLNSRVQAIEDTPGVGQFGAGKLGTIAGSTTDGRIKAEDDGTGSVNGWSDLKGRVSTAEGQIMATQNDVSGIMSDISAIETKNTQQDAAISGLQSSKVNVAQGAENAGKALVVGNDGNLTPQNISGGEMWEEIDLSNFPSTGWADGDRIRVLMKRHSPSEGGNATSWTSAINKITSYSTSNYPAGPVVEFVIRDAGDDKRPRIMLGFYPQSWYIQTFCLQEVYDHYKWNTPGGKLFTLFLSSFNGSNCINYSINVTSNDVSTHVYQMWRLKK